jgi:integrase
MLNRPVNTTHTFAGPLGEVCEKFIAEKRGTGLKSSTESKQLSALCRFSLDYSLEPGTLPEDFVRAWIAKKPHETESNRHHRYISVRQLAGYMKRMGYSAFCPEKEDVAKHTTTFVPYIFTHEEIQRLLTAAETSQNSKFSSSPHYHIIMPAVLRTLYCCGLRVSEALNLLVSDVDCTQNLLTVRESKLGKSRYVPMSQELSGKLSEYAVLRPDSDWFFPAPDGGFYTPDSVYDFFRKTLSRAEISHGGRGKGPRVHDLRHTMAVHSLQRFVASGCDVTAFLPKLSAYLGHDTMRYTEPYVRMTAEVYPEISELLQQKYGDLIPQAEGWLYENN